MYFIREDQFHLIKEHNCIEICCLHMYILCNCVIYESTVLLTGTVLKGKIDNQTVKNEKNNYTFRQFWVPMNRNAIVLMIIGFTLTFDFVHITDLSLNIIINENKYR